MHLPFQSNITLEKMSSLFLGKSLMGCVVNGPGEAKEADIGIAGGDGKGILFKKGKVIRKIAQDELVSSLLKEIDEMTTMA